MKKETLQYIEKYQLEIHPEGGYFKETLKAEEMIDLVGRETRPLYTSILFFLYGNEVSHFLKLQSDEIWIHQKGDPLDVVCIHTDGKLEIIHLGFAENCVQQAVVKAGAIFGSFVPNKGNSLVACIVSPGFLYNEFELYKKDQLRKLYPQHYIWIERLGL